MPTCSDDPRMIAPQCDSLQPVVTIHENKWFFFAISSNRYPVLPWIYQIDISKQELDKRKPHDDEVVSVECITFEEVKEKIIQGEIYVSLPLAIVSRFLFSEK